MFHQFKKLINFNRLSKGNLSKLLEEIRQMCGNVVL